MKKRKVIKIIEGYLWSEGTVFFEDEYGYWSNHINKNPLTEPIPQRKIRVTVEEIKEG